MPLLTRPRLLLPLLALALTACSALGLPGSSARPGTRATLLGPSVQPALLAPEEVAGAAGQLTSSVAELNAAQLSLLRSENGPRFDEILGAVAAHGFNLGRLAEATAAAIAAQQDGSPGAAAAAGPYTDLARFGFIVALEAQLARAQIAAGETTPDQAASSLAAYGARLWTPAAGGSPFAEFDSPDFPTAAPAAGIPAGLAVVSWLAASPATIDLTLDFELPPASSASPLSPEGGLLFSAPAGQADPSTGMRAAAERLAALTGHSFEAGSLTVRIFAGAALAGPDAAPLGFPGGTLSLLHGSTGGEPGLSAAVYALDASAAASPAAEVPLTTVSPAVILEISEVVITTLEPQPVGSSPFRARAGLSVQVRWTTALPDPKFELRCGDGTSVPVSGDSGSASVPYSGLLVVHPGIEHVYCIATSASSQTLGTVTRSALIGEPPQATQQAAQAATESASFSMTRTAAPLETAAAEGTASAAATTTQAAAELAMTEAAVSQTAAVHATATESARQTAAAPTHTPTPTASATPTFVPVLIQTLFIPGNQYSVATQILQSGRLYRICLFGTVYLADPPLAASPDDIMFVDGVKVPASGCLVVVGTNTPALVHSSQGITPAEEPGGYQINVEDLGPG